MFSEYTKWYRTTTFEEKVTSVTIAVGFIVLAWALLVLCAVFNPTYGK